MDDGVLPEHLSEHFGQETGRLVAQVFEEGVDRAVLLMRHSARTFDRSINDLLNDLTDHGRNLCASLGESLPKDLRVRGYASPPRRCVETAELVINAHVAAGGDGARTRALEALGVFYVLDQQKMWKILTSSNGLADYVAKWFAEELPVDAMIPAPQAVDLVMQVLLPKLATPMEGRSLDLCVTHDMTVFTMRHGLGLEPVSGPDVEFLDGLILFEKGGRKFVRSHHGGEIEVS
ncbi:MAG: hypothetical protein GKR90_00735 [Pseudomonadales bacterium]|nr:hypothetical protein [Pseudomonadales bacterium]